MATTGVRNITREESTRRSDQTSYLLSARIRAETRMNHGPSIKLGHSQLKAFRIAEASAGTRSNRMNNCPSPGFGEEPTIGPTFRRRIKEMSAADENPTHLSTPKPARYLVISPTPRTRCCLLRRGKRQCRCGTHVFSSNAPPQRGHLSELTMRYDAEQVGQYTLTATGLVCGFGTIGVLQVGFGHSGGPAEEPTPISTVDWHCGQMSPKYDFMLRPRVPDLSVWPLPPRTLQRWTPCLA